MAAAPNQPTPQDVLQIYIRFRDGLPPQPQNFSQAFQALNIKLTALRSLNIEIARGSSRQCRRFIDLTDKTYRQITSLLTDLSNQRVDQLTSLYQRARLQILISLASVQYRQVQADQEAGFGILDRGLKHQCEVDDRPHWKQTILDVLKNTQEASSAIVGVSGLRTMIATEDELARAVAQKEKRDNRKFWVSVGAGLIASALAWEFAPWIGASLFPVLGSTSWARWGLRFMGLTGEVVTQNYVHDFWVFPEDRILRNRKEGITWSDFMASAETLLDSPLESPRIYYDSLTRFHGALNARMYESLIPWERLLVSAERAYGSVDSALAQMENRLP